MLAFQHGRARAGTLSREVGSMVGVREVVIVDLALLRVLNTYANLQRVVLALQLRLPVAI